MRKNLKEILKNMKRSKKMLLGTIAAMGALAVGTGAVSTFAWYTVNAATVDKNVSVTGEMVAANNTYTSGTITFSLEAAVTNASALILTDDYGQTYYKSGSTTYLDVSKVGAFAAGTQYGTLTLTLKASVAADKSVAESLNGLIDGYVDCNFTVMGTQNTAFKCIEYNNLSTPTNAPTQSDVKSAVTDGYTEKTATSVGSSRWVDERTATWADAGHASNKRYTVTASSAPGNEVTLGTWKWFIGLDGSVMTAKQTLTITPTLVGDGVKINFGA